MDCDWFETIFMGFNSPLSCGITIGGVVKVWFGGGQPWVHSCSFLSVWVVIVFCFFVNASQISPISIIVPIIEIIDPSDDMLFHSV